MSKYTPGPWKLITCKSNPNVTWIAPPDAEGMGDGFATVWSVGKENARLIAAAPELLHALQGFINNSNWLDWPADIYQAAEAAIAKATGEQA